MSADNDEINAELSDLKGQRRVLAQWMAEALLTLETIDPDELDHGSKELTRLLDSGKLLVDAVLGGGADAGNAVEFP